MQNKQQHITEAIYIGDYEIYRKSVGGLLKNERKTVHISDDKRSRSETEVSQKRYKYVMKELDNETGLYYYGMRYYASWFCRFVSVDPLQHKYPELTPFQYAGNKPISFIDLDGAEEAKPDDNKRDRKFKNFKTDSFNNLIIDDLKQTITMYRKGESLEAYHIAHYNIYTIKKNKKINVWKNMTAKDGTKILSQDESIEKDPRWDQNCHGYTFLRSENFWIYPDDALIILKSNYKRILKKNNVQIGDIITYHDEKQVIKKDDAGESKIAKWTIRL